MPFLFWVCLVLALVLVLEAAAAVQFWATEDFVLRGLVGLVLLVSAFVAVIYREEGWWLIFWPLVALVIFFTILLGWVAWMSRYQISEPHSPPTRLDRNKRAWHEQGWDL